MKFISKIIAKLSPKKTNERTQYSDYDDICNHFIKDIADILKQWKDECRYKYDIQFKIDFLNKKIILYTPCPGILIGCKGKYAEKYIKILNERVLIINIVDFVMTELISI